MLSIVVELVGSVTHLVGNVMRLVLIAMVRAMLINGQMMECTSWSCFISDDYLAL
jgi:hypothetical protein